MQTLYWFCRPTQPPSLPLPCSAANWRPRAAYRDRRNRVGYQQRLESPYEDGVALAGLGVFLVTLPHKPLDSYSIISMMKYAGHSQRARTLTNVGFAMLCPVVALASFVGGGIAWPGRRDNDRLCAVLCGGRVFVHCLERPVTGDPFPQPRSRQAHPLPPRGNQSRLCTLNPTPFMAHDRKGIVHVAGQRARLIIGAPRGDEKPGTQFVFIGEYGGIDVCFV